MAKSKITLVSIKAMADASGIELTSEELEQLLDQIQISRDELDLVDNLNLGDVEPAIVFLSESP